MRIGELAALTGVSVRALRNYEQKRLLIPARSPSGHRHYYDDAVERVRFFQDMFAAGLSSENTATLLPCIDSGHTNVQQQEMLHLQRSKIATQVDRLAAA